MAKPKNLVPTETLTISTTPGTVRYLERITATNLYGKTAAETADEIIRQEIRRLIATGQLDDLTTRTPNDMGTDESAAGG